VTDSFLGDGLVFDEALPVAWTPGPLPQGLALARLNADNAQLLGAESSLDEVRVHDTLKDESPALVHELQRLEYKLNVLLRLTADLALQSRALPPAQHVKLTSRALEWFGDVTPAVGSTGLLAVYINSALPQPLKIPCTVVGERLRVDARLPDDVQLQDAALLQDAERVVQLQYSGLSETVVEQIDRLIFRHHRRLVAGARLASH
jgi:hypothetical protein